MSIKLADEDSEVAPVPAGKVGHVIATELDYLSAILSDFNDMFGNIDWNDADNIKRQILAIPEMVSKDERYQKCHEKLRQAKCPYGERSCFTAGNLHIYAAVEIPLDCILECKKKDYFQ